MRRAFVLASVLSAVSGLAQAQDAAKLAQEKTCFACHATDKKLVGPSYKDVAAKYAGKKDAVSMLVTKVMKGGAGVWGTMPMPPQAVSDAEARVLVDWILKQK